MRVWAIGLTCVLVLCGAAPSYAQQTGPRTLEGLLKSDAAQKPVVAAAEAAATDAGPKRPAGTVARLRNGVQHPDLDKAWADYDAAVAKVTEEMRAAINKQFDAATAKGDLDAAEKWQVIGEKFEKAGELPAEKEIKAAVSGALAELKKAGDELTKAYEDVVKALTIEKKIADAKAVRDELRLTSVGNTPALKPHAPAQAKQKNAPAEAMPTIVGKWEWDGRVLAFLPDGTTNEGHRWRYDKATGLYSFSWNALGELSKDGRSLTELFGQQRIIHTRVTD